MKITPRQAKFHKNKSLPNASADARGAKYKQIRYGLAEKFKRLQEKKAIFTMTEAIFKLANYLPFRLFVASSSVSSLLSSACDTLYDMKMAEWRTMAALSEYGPSTQFALCRSTYLDKVSISRAVQSLIHRRLIHRTSAMRDGRSHLLDLTPAGRECCAELFKAANRYEAALVVDFTPEEVVLLKSYLVRLQIAAESARHPAHQALANHEAEADIKAAQKREQTPS